MGRIITRESSLSIYIHYEYAITDNAGREFFKIGKANRILLVSSAVPSRSKDLALDYSMRIADILVLKLVQPERENTGNCLECLLNGIYGNRATRAFTSERESSKA